MINFLPPMTTMPRSTKSRYGGALVVAWLSAFRGASACRGLPSGFAAAASTPPRRDRRRSAAVLVAAKKTADSLDTAIGAGKGAPRRRACAPAEPLHWHDGDGRAAMVTSDAVPAAGDSAAGGGGEGRTRGRKRLRFTIRGAPRALARHRTGRGFTYNPSRPAQDSFRACLLELLPRAHRPTILDDVGESERPPELLFPRHEYLKMSLVFRLRRPKSHFVGGRPGRGRLRPSAPGRLHRGRADVDNLAKFVMDALNGLVYEDDRQVVHLDAIKVLDSEGECLGATEVDISVLEE